MNNGISLSEKVGQRVFGRMCVNVTQFGWTRDAVTLRPLRPLPESIEAPLQCIRQKISVADHGN